MRDIKEKPERPKVKNNAFKERRPAAKTNAAGRVGRLMKKRYLRERDKGRKEQEPNAVTAAEEQAEQYTGQAVSTVGGRAIQGMDKVRQTIRTRQVIQAQRQAKKQDVNSTGNAESPSCAADCTAEPPEAVPDRPQPPSPGDRMKQAAIKEKKAQAIKERPIGTRQDTPYAGSAGHAAAPPDTGAQTMQNIRRARPEAAQKAPGRLTAPDNPSGAPPAIREKPPNRGPAIKTRQAAQTVKRRNTVKEPVQAPAPPPRTAKQAKAIRTTRAAGASKAKAAKTAQERGKQLAVSRARQAVQAAASVGKKAAQTIAHAAAALFHALIGAVGGVVLLVALCIIILVAAVVASPFGIFFADQQKEPGAISPSAAVAQINVEYAARLAELQEGDYDSIQIHGGPPDWREVIAVFACKTAGADDGVDVTVFDEDRVERLRQVFWDMTPIQTEVEVIKHEDWTEVILHIYIEAKTIDEMREEYRFTKYQNEALDALLEEMDLLGGLLGDLDITQEDALALLENLPDDLSPERRAVIQHALTLVGKVNYFWGGKSLVIGWDSRWGTTQKVTAAGSPSTGTYRPYGMDCSGFVDWVFYNATGGEYVIGHGGGAASQHTYCTPISWSEALPGDLVFYPGDNHVGIVDGRDENGNLLIIHCSSGANNVVITGLQGFTSIGRPVYFGG